MNLKFKLDMNSPLRYPGGKSRVAKDLIKLFPKCVEYREVFFGGGSVFLNYFNPKSKQKYVLSDKYSNLMDFWFSVKLNNSELINGILKLKDEYKSRGKEMFYWLKNKNTNSVIDSAIRFFILNRISFSGLTESGGYSEHAFYNRFTDNSINNIWKMRDIFKKVELKCVDYKEIVMEKGNDVFIFADPPYYSARSKKLYGKNGDMHLSFDHKSFAKVMEKCPHKWLITLDDCEKTRELFDYANILEFEVQYGMNNYKQLEAKKGKEIIITNFLSI